VENPPVRETLNRRPRGRQHSRERRHQEGSRAYRIEGRIYDADRSRSPPVDRRRSGSAWSSGSRNQRRDSQGYSSGDDFSGMERSLHLILQKRLFEQIADTVPYCDGNKMIGLPKGYKITVNQVRDDFFKKINEPRTEDCLLPAEVYCAYSNGYPVEVNNLFGR